MKPTYLNDDITNTFVERLKRGANFKFACQVAKVPNKTARYWLQRGRIELDRGDAEELTPFAKFAQAVDAAMGEAVLSASERLWMDNPALWLRWSYARADYYPIESQGAIAAAKREEEAERIDRERVRSAFVREAEWLEMWRNAMTEMAAISELESWQERSAAMAQVMAKYPEVAKHWEFQSVEAERRAEQGPRLTIEQARRQAEAEVRLKQTDPARWLETVGRGEQLPLEGEEGEVAGD